MAAINQRIPNFLGGVSQQPDTIKFPGQLRVCDNAVPDVTFGLKKRPPGEFVKALTNANSTGHWYEILRDGDEKYLMQITPGNTGSHPIRIWDIADGTEKSFTNSSGDSLYAYLSGATDKYAIQSIQDYTIITNPQKTVGTTGSTDAPLNSGDYAFARLDTIAYNTEYILYTGATAPTPKKYFRATALEVSKTTNVSTGFGHSWDDTDGENTHSGLTQFSFSGGNSITVPSTTRTGANAVDIEGLEGHITVNGASYIASNTANYDGGGSAATNFLGYTQDYDTRYSAQITLKNGGLIKTESKTEALAHYIFCFVAGISYRVDIKAVEEVETYEDVSGIAFYRSPKNPDEGKLGMGTIIKALHDSVNANVTNVTSEVIGSGMYLYGSAAPTVNFLGGAVNEAMNVIGNTAQDVSRLPTQCKHGYVAQIANTENVEADNYYVKFIADNGTQGTGKWEECVRPNNFSSGSDPMVKGLDPATMPHAIVNNRNGTFTFKKLDETTANADSNDNYWKYREVGDDETNPFPSFKGLNIQKIFFHRNRLGIVANEQVVMSRPGDYFNFFVVSAITTSDDNPVDITVSDIKPAYIHHVLPINKGIMMFSDNGQFILFTESDIFSPKTARLKKISSYESDASLQPVDMGTSIMFTSAVSAYARAYEATILDDDVPPKIIEQTRVVPEYLPKTIDIACNSTAIGINTFAKTGSTEVYHYKFFDSGERRDQSAWYSWTLTGTLRHCFYTAGSFYTVTLQGSAYVLNRYEYVADATAARTYTLGSGTVGSPLSTSRWFEVCLDNMTIPTAINYTAQGGSVTGPDFTDLTIPYTPTSATDFYAVGIAGNDSENVVGTINVTAGGSGYTVAPTVTISGGGGSGATATAHLKGPPASDSNLGVVDRITVDNVGSGYTSTPTVSFSGGNGTGAAATAVTGNPVAGTVVKASSVNTNKATFEEVDMTGWTVAVGYSYTTLVELPSYYMSIEPGQYDIDADLRISGMNFEMGVSGPMEFHVESKYADMDDYIQYESGMKLDDSDFGKPPSSLMKTIRVPIQKKNEKYTLQVKVTDPFSTALISASWDGIYNQRRHARK